MSNRPFSVNLEELLHSQHVLEAGFSSLLHEASPPSSSILPLSSHDEHGLEGQDQESEHSSHHYNHPQHHHHHPHHYQPSPSNTLSSTARRSAKHLSLPSGTAPFYRRPSPPPLSPHSLPSRPASSSSSMAHSSNVNAPLSLSNHAGNGSMASQSILYESTIAQIQRIQADETFRRECTAVDQWFQVLSENEQTSALFSLLQHLSPSQVHFFALLLNQVGSGLKAKHHHVTSTPSQLSSYPGSGCGLSVPDFHNPRRSSASPALSSSFASGEISFANNDKRSSALFDGNPTSFREGGRQQASKVAPPGLSPNIPHSNPVNPPNYKRHSHSIISPVRLDDAVCPYGKSSDEESIEFLTLRTRLADFTDQQHFLATQSAPLTDHSHSAVADYAYGSTSRDATKAFRHSIHVIPSMGMTPAPHVSKADQATNWRSSVTPTTISTATRPSSVASTAHDMHGASYPVPVVPTKASASDVSASSSVAEDMYMSAPSPYSSSNDGHAAFSLGLARSSASPPVIDQAHPSAPIVSYDDDGSSTIPVAEAPSLYASSEIMSENNNTATTTTIPIPHPSTMPLSAWLKALRLHKYTPLFEGMEWRTLVAMNEEELMEKGVLALGARRKMLKVFESIR